MSLAASQGIFAVVINWNGGEENLRCLNALLAAGLDGSHIVFVDNGSVRGSHKQVRRNYGHMIWVQNSENRGFTGAANQGAQRALQAGAQWILFVNNDLDLDEAALQRMLSVAATDPAIKALGPRILMPADNPGMQPSIWSYGGDWNKGWNMVRLTGHGQPDGLEYQTTRDVDFLTGAALLVRADAWQEIGGFEASYFAYVEDVELCHRIRDNGWRVVCVGEASALHHASSSTGGGYSARRKYMMALNSVRLLKRRGTLLGWLRLLFVEILFWPLLLVVSLLKGQMRGALAKGLGMLHGLLGIKVSAKTVEPGGSLLW